jgi:transposase
MDHPCIFVGIDVSSKSLDLWLTPTTDSPHSHLDYSERALDAWLAKHPELTPNTAIVGVESTGEYHLAVTKYFLKKNFQVKILNPILTKQYVRTTIRGIKTDKSDAEVITMLLQAGHGEFACLQGIMDQDKELLRLAATIRHHAVALRLRLQSTERKDLPSTEEITGQLQGVIDSMQELSDKFIAQATEVTTQEEALIDSIPGFATHLPRITLR